MIVHLAAGIVLILPVMAMAQDDAGGATSETPRPSIYNAQSDANIAVASAASRALRDHRRVLVMFGGDWCGWCHKLHNLFETDEAIRDLLAEEYVLVMVDTEAPHAAELLKRCQQDKPAEGYPFLAVLDGKGTVLTRQDTAELEEGDHHDPAKVKAFLETWVAPRADASRILAAAQARARSEGKLVFLHTGAPWCGWCRRLESFLARNDMAAIFEPAFVDAKIDVDRMTGVEPIIAAHQPLSSGGIPWFVFLNGEGDEIATSLGPQGNIGYPVNSEEIDHFTAMLQKAGKLTPEQIETVATALRAEAEKIRPTLAEPAPGVGD